MVGLGHLDPQVRRPALAVALFAAAIIVGIAVGLFAGADPVDQRWVEFDEPVLIGNLDDEQLTVLRDVTLEGAPIVYDNVVPITFHRCGPVADVEAVSARTWVLSQGGDLYLGLEGETITIVIEAAGCNTFQFDYPIPDQVLEALEALGPDADPLLRVRFAITPIDPQLGSIVLETERFVRAVDYSNSTFADLEVIPARQTR